MNLNRQPYPTNDSSFIDIVDAFIVCQSWKQTPIRENVYSKYSVHDMQSKEQAIAHIKMLN